MLLRRGRRARESAKNLSTAAAASYTSTVQPFDKQANLLSAASFAVSHGSKHESDHIGVLDKIQLQASSKRPLSTSSDASSAKRARRKPGMSTMGLTPGTPIMAEIEASLEFYICQRLQKWRHLEFELSGARVQVNDALTQRMPQKNSKSQSKTTCICIQEQSALMSLALASCTDVSSKYHCCHCWSTPIN